MTDHVVVLVRGRRFNVNKTDLPMHEEAWKFGGAPYEVLESPDTTAEEAEMERGLDNESPASNSVETDIEGRVNTQSPEPSVPVPKPRKRKTKRAKRKATQSK